VSFCLKGCLIIDFIYWLSKWNASGANISSSDVNLCCWPEIQTYPLQDLQQSIINLSKSMRATINCEKMNVWHQTRPWQMARCAMKGIVASQECNFLNGFERKTHTPSCMYSKRCQLLCLCVRISHRNSNVPSGCHRICHCRLSWTKPFYWNLHGHTNNISFVFI
jgi:hypothetical protein